MSQSSLACFLCDLEIVLIYMIQVATALKFVQTENNPTLLFEQIIIP